MTITGIRGTGQTAGTATFKLYSNATCSDVPGQQPVYTAPSVDVPSVALNTLANRTVSTTDATDANIAKGYTTIVLQELTTGSLFIVETASTTERRAHADSRARRCQDCRRHSRKSIHRRRLGQPSCQFSRPHRLPTRARSEWASSRPLTYSATSDAETVTDSRKARYFHSYRAF